jgi:type I restriction-modification system DNA methylase subunit
MDLSKLKAYAPQARRDFIHAMTERAALFGLTKASVEPMTESADVVVIGGREYSRKVGQQRRKLDSRIKRDGFDQTMEAMAYTWFNRFVAIRYMELHGYLEHGFRVLSHPDGKDVPEILDKVRELSMPGLDEAKVKELRLVGSKDRELYRLLLLTQCNALSAAMPFLFEKIDDETELLLPDNLLSTDSLIRKLVAKIEEKEWKEIEIIGWLYQFYISEKKDDVFAGLKKNQKITAENIPAATQLFTPHWIVRYLVENSLGRLWLLNKPKSRLAEKMPYYIAPEEPETDFLRVSKPEEIRICDPACGSAHMLIYTFDLLYEIYLEQGYPAHVISQLILTNNLFGIEIDERAGALAAFALFMKAVGRDRKLLRKPVQPNICVLKNVSFTDGELDDYMNEVGRDLFSADLRATLAQFSEAKNFGSLIVPKLKEDGEIARVIASKDFESNLFLREVHERVKVVLGMAETLAPKYHVVVANPPYMGSKGMNGRLSDYTKASYRDARADLMTCFMQRSSKLVLANGYWGMINLPSWMFLSSFESFRRHLLSTQTIMSLLHLGRGIFGSDFGSVAFCIKTEAPGNNALGLYRRLFDRHVDVRVPSAIEERFKDKLDGYFLFNQARFENIPGCPITYWLSEALLKGFENKSPITSIGKVLVGLQTGDNDRFTRYWHEVSFDGSSGNLVGKKAGVELL